MAGGRTHRIAAVCALSAALAATAAWGQEWRGSGKLLATGGVSTVEGMGGGGLTPWALITGYGAEGQIGANVFGTRVRVRDFGLDVVGVGLGVHDRLELTLARQAFDTRDAGAALGLGRGFTFHQDIVGLKWRFAGDAVYGQDSWMPQLALGLQHKRNDREAIVKAVGARSASGTDVTLSATKLMLEQSLLWNVTLRATKANQLGILGFGGDRRDRYSAQLEGSAAWLLNKRTAVGLEYRGKPNNLGFADESDWADVFVAYFPNKHLSLTAAYVRLGEIATFRRQSGWYFSLQAGF
jgi:hypothetical protein